MLKKYFNKNILSLVYLIIIGELVFSLPFHISRFFRPSLLDDYNYSNTMLGIAFSVYGITALLSYLPGGYIADKVSPKYLLFLSLLLTSMGGLFLLLNPSFFWLCVIYGYWGLTTILFFWAALIKATRNIAGERQGLSFGALEAGRGLVASLCASLAVVIYSSNIITNFYFKLFSKDISSLTVVIFYYSFMTFLSSIMILFLFKNDLKQKTNKIKVRFDYVYSHYKPIICISIVVLAAYAGYKGIDYYALYFYEVFGYSKEKSALIVANLSYLRPISALSAGIIADRVTSKLSSLFLFILLLLSYSFLVFIEINNHMLYFLYFNFITTMIAIFSLRGIFYSLLQEMKLPLGITGIAVGIVSFIGYMPDIFIGPIFGYFLDNYDNLKPFQLCFLTLLALSIFGFASSFYLRKIKI
ncbi:MAG: Inner membrane protein YihN [Alphaproteobacteria bacterium MarineAlpha9_Bin4]|nr:MFS transporter [Pelagibacterales bacterium]PPR25607.1 MAG: Inner membrane protein YihN [Alphaproteobacteria bacterium MarineAlpha9_Bin4]